jgi:hypothetical protein
MNKLMFELNKPANGFARLRFFVSSLIY